MPKLLPLLGGASVVRSEGSSHTLGSSTRTHTYTTHALTLINTNDDDSRHRRSTCALGLTLCVSVYCVFLCGVVCCWVCGMSLAHTITVCRVHSTLFPVECWRQVQYVARLGACRLRIIKFDQSVHGTSSRSVLSD